MDRKKHLPTITPSGHMMTSKSIKKDTLDLLVINMPIRKESTIKLEQISLVMHGSIYTTQVRL